MKNLIRIVVLVLILLSLIFLISCIACSKVESVVEAEKANATAETMGNTSTISVVDIGEDTSLKTWVKDDAEILKQEDIDKINEMLTDLKKILLQKLL